jgi:hypothetical protein
LEDALREKSLELREANSNLQSALG